MTKGGIYTTIFFRNITEGDLLRDKRRALPGRRGHAGPGLYPLFPLSGGGGAGVRDGTVFTGCNIENAAYGCTICAERTAIFKAVSEGHRDFVRIVIAGKSEDYCVPCGSCRQVMMEFAPELEVICLNGQGQAKSFRLRELLPTASTRAGCETCAAAGLHFRGPAVLSARLLWPSGIFGGFPC